MSLSTIASHSPLNISETVRDTDFISFFIHMVYLIDPFQFIINNDTQITTRCNLINNLIIYTQQSFIIFRPITRDTK